MGRKKKLGPVARMGVRYGRTVRKRLAEVEVGLRRLYVCPKCGVEAVKRMSVGVWRCRKCGYKFTGGAYVPFTKLGEVAKRSAKRIMV